MRRKQAKPARRITGEVFLEGDGSVGDSRELLSPAWHSPSSSPPPPYSGTISATDEPDDSTGSSFRASGIQDAADVFHNDTPPLKVPKYEPDDFRRYYHVGEGARFPRSQFAHSRSVNGHSPRVSASYSVPIISGVSDRHKSFFSMFTANRNSPQSSSFDIPSTSVSRADGSAELTDSDSPLKRLERCVRANSEAGCSTFGVYRSSRPSASTRYALTQSRSNANSMKLRFGYGKFIHKYCFLISYKL